MKRQSQQVRALIVDDEHIIADTLTLILKASGHDAVAVYSAEQAIDWCGANRADVVISDVCMSPMNGVQLAFHLTRIMSECKILLISGNAQMVEGLSTGRHGFHVLGKPVHPDQILHFVGCAKRGASLAGASKDDRDFELCESCRLLNLQRKSPC